ncbi:MAG: PD-(D/E)XK nuclease family protein [Candidatus Bathyarchaeia archaeon]
MSWNRFPPRPNTYHVTELTGCLAKAYFSRTRRVQETVESAWAKLRGSMLHYVVRSLGWSELKVSLRFPLKAEDITIVGHVDAYNPETATVYDLKTTSFVKWQAEKNFIPRDSHVAQVQSYSTLLDKYAIPVSRLILVYVDDKELIPLEVPLGNRREWLLQRASTLHLSLLEDKTSEPEPNSWCKYCPFKDICPAYKRKDS